MDLPGDPIGGRYQVLEPLARGGQASAYLALDQLHGLEVVIKQVSATAAETLRREFCLLSRLRHPNLVQVLDLLSLDADEKAYLVQSHAPGPDFVSWAAADQATARICLAAAAAARALQYIHLRGVVHRDVKPGNMRIGAGLIGSLPAVRLIDFGLATQTPGAEVAGTLGYMAPEVLAGEPATAASDIYGLGVVLFESLMGRLPHQELTRLGEGVPISGARIGADLGELLSSMLDPAPERRLSIQMLLEGLGHLAGRPVALEPRELAGPYLPHPPLMGRDSVLQRIDEVVTRVREGGAQALHLTGCGKSTIAREARLRAKLAGFSVVSAAGPTSLENLAAVPPSSSVENAAMQVVELLLARARARPLMLDLDLWAADAGRLLEALGRAVGRGDAAGLLVVATGDAVGGDGWEEIDLGCLDREQSQEMVRGMLEPLDVPIWVDRVHDVTGGDPRLIVDLVRAQIEAGLPETLELPPKDDTPPAQRRFALDRAGLVWKRLQSLGEGERDLLGTLAVARQPIPRRLLEAVAPEVPPGTLPALIHRGFVQTTAQGVGLASLCLREAALSCVLEEARAGLHERFAEAYEAEEHPDVGALAHHLLRAGQARLGAEALLRTSAAAIEDLELAAELLPDADPLWVDVLRRLARLARAGGELERALAVAGRLAEHLPDEGTLLRTEILLDAGQPTRALAALEKVGAQSAASHLLAARAHFLLGDNERVSVEARAGRDAPEVTPLLDVQLGNLAGLSLVYSGQVEQGLELLGQAEQAARALGDLEALARVLNSRGIGLQRLGRLEPATAAYRECLDLAHQLGDLRFAASCTLNLGTLAHLRLDLPRALAHYRRAGLLAHRGGSDTTRASAISNEANLLLLFGALEEAAALLDQAEAIADRVGSTAELGYTLLYRAELELMKRDAGRAGAALSRAQSAFAGADHTGRDAADLLLGELSLRLHRDASTPSERGQHHERVRRCVDELLARMALDDSDRWRAHALAARVALAESPPALARAAQQLELAVALAGERGARCLTWEAHALLVRCYAEGGRPEEAAFFGARLHAVLRDIRRRIPLPYRPSFDRRDDVQSCRLQMERLQQPAPGIGPPAEDLKRLLEINKQINSQLPLDRLLHRILEGAIDLTGAERGFVLLKEENDRLQLAASRNVDGESLRRGMDKFSRSIARMAIAEARPVITADALGDPRFEQRLSISGLRLRAVLCVPLHMRGAISGALYVDNRFRAGAFDQQHTTLMESFADQAGIAIEGARMLQETTRQRAQLEEAKAELERLNRDLSARVARQDEELTEMSVRLKAQEEELVHRYNAERIIGRSKPMRELYVNIDRVSESDLPVSILGESGTGKELVARAIHRQSPRASQPFVSINCGAIAPGLLESELFGHLRGAFTGATRDRPGLFEVAGEGTVLLDEVGDMPPEMQVKLLRILQEATYRRVGDERERRSRCRVLSASHERLGELVACGRFREDLYYRLCVIQIEVPPLRERREDIPLLVEHFIALAGTEVKVSTQAMAALMDFDWPGNVRQLENEVQRAVVLSDGVVEPSCLSIPVPGKLRPRLGTTLQEELRRHERRLVQAALDDAEGSVSEAAEKLGMHRVALYRKIRNLGIERA
jgi:transcriptional regulator with GAF, ATPase, and Fis domain